MRIIRELPHRACRITIFAWNNRYLIKLEQGLLEQTFKVDQFDFQTEDDVVKLIDSTFLEDALLRFGEMAKSVQAARERNDL